MTKQQVRARIEETGIIPAVRMTSAEDARFAANAVSIADIHVIEITMTVQGAVELIEDLVRGNPQLIVGAGITFEMELAQRCVDAGATFLTSPGLDLEMVRFAASRNVLAIPGALTPTEIMNAWKAGADMVKIFPCGQLGGPAYIRELKAPFPEVPLIASGGVTRHTAAEFIAAGASALGIGGELIPREAVHLRNTEWIHELAHRFKHLIAEARQLKGSPTSGNRRAG